MKRNTNAVFKAFNDTIVSELAAAGITPTPLSWLSGRKGTPEFEIETRAGKYTFHHGRSIVLGDKRPLTFNPISVFGRFEDPAKARALGIDCNPYSGKWNHAEGTGYVATAEKAAQLAKYIVSRILSI